MSYTPRHADRRQAARDRRRLRAAVVAAIALVLAVLVASIAYGATQTTTLTVTVSDASGKVLSTSQVQVPLPVVTVTATPSPLPTTPAPTTPPTATSGAIDLYGVHDKVWDGVTFDGAGDGYGDSSGVIRIGANCYNLTFRNCVIKPNRDGAGNGVKIFGNGNVHDIRFENCTIETQPRMGFECIGRAGDGYQRVDLVNCTIEPQGSEAVSYDDDTGQAGYCLISGNLIKGGGKTTLYSWGQGFELNNVAHMTVTKNTLWSCRGDGWNLQMAGGRACDWTFTDNVCDFSQGTIASKSDNNPICCQGVSGGVFHGNTVVNKVGWVIAYFSGCKDMDWTGNTWKGPNATPYQTGCSGMKF